MSTAVTAMRASRVNLLELTLIRLPWLKIAASGPMRTSSGNMRTFIRPSWLGLAAVRRMRASDGAMPTQAFIRLPSAWNDGISTHENIWLRNADVYQAILAWDSNNGPNESI